MTLTAWVVLGVILASTEHSQTDYLARARRLLEWAPAEPGELNEQQAAAVAQAYALIDIAESLRHREDREDLRLARPRRVTGES